MGDKVGPDVLFRMKDINIDQLIKVVKKKEDEFNLELLKNND